jgi:hypothetical protein
MDENSLMMYLEPGENHVLISLKYESRTGCGLIPLGCKCDKVETEGLLYNLGNIKFL